MRSHACPPCAPSVQWVSIPHHDRIVSGCGTYKGLHGAVESVTVVAAELGVNTLEGGVTVGLGLLDTVRGNLSATRFWCRMVDSRRM